MDCSIYAFLGTMGALLWVFHSTVPKCYDEPKVVVSLARISDRLVKILQKDLADYLDGNV